MLEAEYIYASKHVYEVYLQEESNFSTGGLLAFLSTPPHHHHLFTIHKSNTQSQRQNRMWIWSKAYKLTSYIIYTLSKYSS
jgi:hypothetical protein